MGFIGKHWKGEYPLGVAFWVIFVLLTAVYHLLEPLLQRLLAGQPFVYIGATIAYLVMCRLVIYPWQIVGLLRTTDRHYLVHENNIIRYGVQATIVVSLALTVAHVIGSIQGLAVYKQRIEAEARPHEKGYVLELVAQGRLLRLKGSLDFGVVEAVTAALDANPGVEGLILDSGGGQIYEGRGLSILIDRRGLDTYSFEGCSSACSTAFIGGRHRYLGENARLGFHRYRLESRKISQYSGFYDLGKEEQKDLALYRAKRLPETFLQKIFETPYDQMWFPDTQTLMDAGVINGRVEEREVLK